MAHLALKLFGSPEVKLDSDLLRLEGRISVALLAYLAITGQLHTRDALATFFWPEHGQARTQLRNNLWVLKRDLGAWGKTWIGNDHETIGLLPNAPLWVDVRHFNAQLAAGQVHAHEPGELCADCLTHYNEAVTLYRADFLAGFTLRASPAFDEWHFFQQESLRRDCATVLATLVQHHRRQGEFTPAIHHARRWLALDPLHEPVHRTLMQLYAETGEYAAALRQYQTCKRYLQTELQAPPDPETEAIYQAIKANSQPLFLAAPLQKSSAAPEPNHPPEPLAPAAMIEQAPPNNLLEPLTPLVGRTQERRFLQNLLRRSDVRLVTLTGTGGIGKTRLALQVAADLLAHFYNGVYFVSLAPIREANLVLTALAQTLNVRETGSRTLIENVVSYLQSKALLLVLDNFEHVVSAAPLITDLLARCPRLKILVTSREVLHLRAEHEFSVPALGLPVRHQPLSLDTLTQYEAVQLFIQRTQAVKPDFTVNNASASAVAEICLQLDGLPLAIELAAARCKFFSPQALLQKLATSLLGVLRGGMRDMPERHQTLRNTIAWSYDLLDADERKLFQQLAVFVGGFTLEAAAYVCTLHGEKEDVSVQDKVLSLVDKSLVRQEMEMAGEPRFVLLETIREFGIEELQASGAHLATQHRFAAYYLQLVEQVEPALKGAEQGYWLDRLELENANLWAVLRWALEQKESELGLRVASALQQFWMKRGYHHEGHTRLKALLDLSSPSAWTSFHAKALFCLGTMTIRTGTCSDARSIFAQCVAASESMGEQRWRAHAYAMQGLMACRQGDPQHGQACFEQSQVIFQNLADAWGIAYALASRGYHAFMEGDVAETNYAMCEEALRLFEQVNDLAYCGLAFHYMGHIRYFQGHLEEAHTLLAQGMTLSRQVKYSSHLAGALAKLGMVLAEQGDFKKAYAYLNQSISLSNEHRYQLTIVEAFEGYIGLACKLNQPARALYLAGAAARLRKQIGAVPPTLIQRKLTNRLDRMCDALGGDAPAATAWATGKAMTLDEAVAYALAV